jgi:prolyl-tRNA editing enzyme YbaK/EbsC (Cys-tRNA(Pro) deacylase)
MSRVQAALVALGVTEPSIREFDESTATAEQAAAAIGTQVGSIVKSLVFVAGDEPILVLVSGSNRVDTARLGQLLGAPIKRANADRVREVTGFAIGGVPPIGLATTLPAYMDRDLLAYERVWAAAGTPTSVFAVDPHTLARIAGARVVELA